MKGTIRVLVGLLLTLGGVGGMETNVDMMPSLWYAIAGLGLMGWGVYVMKIEDIRD